MQSWWGILFVISALHYGAKSAPGRALVHIETHPYVVSVQEKNQHKCNGVILSRYFVLTSGHCLDNHVNAYSVLAGADDLSAPFQAVRAHALQFVGHEEVEYDMGLIQLKEPLNFTDSNRPIQIPKLHDQVPSQGYLVGFGNYRLSKFRDRLRALKMIVNKSSEVCDKESDMEFCIEQYTGPDTAELPKEEATSTYAPDPKWLEQDKQQPFEWPSGKKEGANRRSMYDISKDLQVLEYAGSGMMNEFALGSPLVNNGVLYGFLSRKSGEIGIMTSMPMFVKYIKSNVYDLQEAVAPASASASGDASAPEIGTYTSPEA